MLELLWWNESARSSKHQPPKCGRSVFGAWMLELLWCLKLESWCFSGVWSLDVGAFSPKARLMRGSFPPTVNPEGIASSSPGLRGTSYPGKSCKPSHNPNGVVAALDTLGHNSYRVRMAGDLWLKRQDEYKPQREIVAWRYRFQEAQILRSWGPVREQSHGGSFP